MSPTLLAHFQAMSCRGAMCQNVLLRALLFLFVLYYMLHIPTHSTWIFLQVGLNKITTN